MHAASCHGNEKRDSSRFWLYFLPYLSFRAGGGGGNEERASNFLKKGDYFYTHHILVVFLLIDGSSQICMNNLRERVEKGGKKALNRCFAKKKFC